MKGIDLATTSRKLHRNHVFNFCDGAHVYLELFVRLNLIQKKEHSLLCDRLLDTPEFKEFLALDEWSKKDFFASSFAVDEDEDCDAFERMMREKKKSFEPEVFDDVGLNDICENIDVPLPLFNSKVLRAFDGVCKTMQEYGYLNGVDLSQAVRTVKEFTPGLSLKSYEYATLLYGEETNQSVFFDINRHNGKELSSLPDCEKAVLLSSIIYATSLDFESVEDIEKADNLQIRLTDVLSGMPEYFYANAVEKINRNAGTSNERFKPAVCENIRKFMAVRLKNFFALEDLSLSERVQVNNNIEKIERISFDSLHSWNVQLRPLIVQISQNTPAYLKKDFRFCVVSDMNMLAGVVAHSDLTAKSWRQILYENFSKCFSPYSLMKRDKLSERMKTLKNLANEALSTNPVWTLEDKMKFFDAVCDLNVDSSKTISKHRKRPGLDNDRTYE